MFNRISTVTGAASSNALVDLAVLKQMLGIDTDEDDAKWSFAIATASAMIQGYCGRLFASQEITDLVRFQPGYGGLDAGVCLQLGVWPVISIVSITDRSGALTSDEYDIDLGPGQVRYLRHDHYHPWITHKIVVVYSAGWTVIPGDVQGICVELANQLYANDDKDASVKRETVPGVYDILYQDSDKFTALNVSAEKILALDAYIVPRI